MTAPADHRPVPEGKIGVLLINLGTPDAPEARAVRRYLAEFLSDPRVIEIHPFAWKPILHGLVLRTRPRKSAEAYNQIWTNEGSPLRVIAHRQAEALRARLPDVRIHYAMRYGNPGIAAAIDAMVREGCTRILTAPLYPQYCAATTATANDAVFGALARMRWQPALRTLPPYYDDPLYIDALSPQPAAAAWRARIRARAAPAELPRHAGAHARTRRSLSLPLPEDRAAARRKARPRGRCRLPVAGSAAPNGWSRRPMRRSAAYPKQGVKRIAVAAPGFSADCLETLEELGIRGRRDFPRSRRRAICAARLPQ